MKIEKIILKANSFFNTDDHKLKDKIKCAKHVLKKLRNREAKLNDKLNNNEGDEISIKTEIKLIHAQRQKGLNNLKIYKKLKKDSKTKNTD